MSGWDFNDKGNGKKLEFTAFPEGVTRIRILSPAPKMAWTHWIMKDKRSIICPGFDCPICQTRKKQKENKEPVQYNVSRRLRIYVYNYDTNRVEILEQGITFFEELADLKKELEREGKVLSGAIFKVKRKGTSKETTSYRIDLDSYEVVDLTDAQYSLDSFTKLEEMFEPHKPEDILRIMSGEAWNDVFGKPVDEDSEAPFTVE